MATDASTCKNLTQCSSQFYQEILSWDYYEALSSAKNAEEKHSPDLVHHPIPIALHVISASITHSAFPLVLQKEIPGMFSSTAEYVHTMDPLMFTECRAQVFNPSHPLPQH